MAYLIQKQKDGSSVKEWDLKNQPLKVGRGDDVDAQIEDHEMSRLHFIIKSQAGGYLLQDQQSTNGTLVNGQRVSEVVLKPNDRIHAGHTDFVLVDGLATVIGQITEGSTGYGTYVRKLADGKK